MLDNIRDTLRNQLHNIRLDYCMLCGTQHNHANGLLCCTCDQSLPLRSSYCHQCGHVLAKNHLICHYCLKYPVLYNDVFSLFDYKPPIDGFIKRLKFQHNLLYASLLGNKMADALTEHTQQPFYTAKKIDAILPVPLHPQRLRQRGFNQALEIARPIAKRLNIPLVTNALIRSRHTQAQTELNAARRRNNLKGSFRYQPTAYYENSKNIAIVDDVMTTGATLHEISQTLKQHASVETIYVWVSAAVTDDQEHKS